MQMHSLMAQLAGAVLFQQQNRDSSCSSGSIDCGLVNSSDHGSSGRDSGCVKACCGSGKARLPRSCSISAEGIDNTESGTVAGFQCNSPQP